MAQPIPPGCEGFIPHLVCDPCDKAIAFYTKALGAKEIMRSGAPGTSKLMHAEILVDDKPIYLCDDFPEFCGGKSRSPQSLGGSPVTIHLYVKDCDAAIDRAVKAGATVTMPATDMFWGDRYGAVTDPFGHCWSFATHKKDMTAEEIEAAAAEAFSQGCS